MQIDRLIYIKGRKSVGILIKDGQVIVRAPKNIPDNKLDAILREKESWVNKKLNDYRGSQKLFSRFIAYEEFLYLGRAYGSPAEIAEAAADIFNLSDKEIRTLIKSTGDVPDKIGKAYKKLAALILPRMLDFYSSKLNFRYSALRIINSKSKWGSCTNKGVISLNWRLIMLPENIAEYIIIHEFCHLKHMNHSKDYWEYVQEFYPDHRQAKKFLKDNNFIIKLF